MFKERYQSVRVNLSIDQSYPVPTPSNHILISGFPLATSRETILYGTSGLGVWYNDCSHFKYEFNTYAGSHTQKTNEQLVTTVFNLPDFHIRESLFQGKPLASRLSSLASDLTSDPSLNHRAFRAMWNRIRIPRYLSLLNFLYELKDFLRMFEFWALRRSQLDNISNGTLNVEFGWRPFLSDVCSLLRGIADMHKHFKKWLAEQHKVHVTHYQKIMTEDNLVPRVLNFDEVGTVDFAIPNRPDNLVGFVAGLEYSISHTTAPLYTATMKYTYWCEGVLTANKELAAMLDAFGIQWDPQILWNALPFSFIVDWFFNVGDWLHSRFSKPNFPVKLRVIDWCTSTKVECLMEGAMLLPLDAQNWSVNLPDTYTYHNMSDKVRAYTRIPGVPYTEDPLKSLGPLHDIEKMVLALALGHNCSRPRKRH
jgi:hypothetical protein